jgi:hypothetical protein
MSNRKTPPIKMDDVLLVEFIEIKKVVYTFAKMQKKLNGKSR